MLTLDTGRDPDGQGKIMYLCSECGKKRRPTFVLFKRGMCHTCYYIKREYQRRASATTAARKVVHVKLDQAALVGGITFSLTALLGAISTALPSWLSYVLLAPIILITLTIFYGMAIGSHLLLMFKIEQRPDCIDTDCEHQPRKIADLTGGQSLWRCAAGHSFYIGQLGFSARRRRWAW